jgi:hypothetical protein
VVSVRCNEDLRLVPQAPEGNGMDDAVAIALEDVAGAARARAVFGMEAAA